MTTSRLLRLPAELRLEIYSYLECPLIITFTRHKDRRETFARKAIWETWTDAKRPELHAICDDLYRLLASAGTPKWNFRQTLLFMESAWDDPTELSWFVNEMENMASSPAIKAAMADHLSAFEDLVPFTPEQSQRISALLINRQINAEVSASHHSRSQIELDMGLDMAAKSHFSLWKDQILKMQKDSIRHLSVFFHVAEKGTSLAPYLKNLVKLVSTCPSLTTLRLTITFDHRTKESSEKLEDRRRPSCSIEVMQRLKDRFVVDTTQAVLKNGVTKLKFVSAIFANPKYTVWCIEATRTARDGDKQKWEAHLLGKDMAIRNGTSVQTEFVIAL